MQLDEEKGEYVSTASFRHPYPATKVMWIPDQSLGTPDLLASSGDYIRLWNVNDDGTVTSKAKLDIVYLYIIIIMNNRTQIQNSAHL